ncbi:MAG: hypothetical protein QXR02_01440 [Acidilobaceae archaeon]
MSDLRQDIVEISTRLKLNSHNGLSTVFERLYEEVSRGAIARYHALLQLIVAIDLHLRGFDVRVEEELPTGFKADVYAESPCCSVIVEVETGYIPQEWILRLEDFIASRVAFKAVAYSIDSDIFILAIPSHLRLLIPNPLLKPIEERDELDISMIRAMVTRYNRNQATRIGWRAQLARIDAIGYINVEEAIVEYIRLNNRNVKLSMLWG